MSNRMITDQKEMERRWSALIAGMEKESVDSLFMYSTDRVYSAYLRYVTDFPTILYPMSALFSPKGISVIGHGSDEDALYPMAMEEDTQSDGKYHVFAGGLKFHDHFIIDNLAVPCAPTTIYASDLWPAKIAELIRKHGYQRVGLVGTSMIPTLFNEYFNKHLPDVEFVDSTWLVDNIKAVKSPYEIEVAKKCVRMIDEIMAAAPSIFKVGRSLRECGRKLRHLADDNDCMDLNIMLGKHPTMPMFDWWNFTDETIIEHDDCILLMVEVSDNVGFWGETARVFSMGEPDEQLVETVRVGFEIQDYIAGLMVPGAISSEVFNKASDFLVSKGFPAEKRFCAHGQGYDVVEMPVIRPENDAPLKEGMFVAIHPSLYIPAKSTGCFLCDNYLITKDGAQRMTTTPKEIIRVNNLWELRGL